MDMLTSGMRLIPSVVTFGVTSETSILLWKTFTVVNIYPQSEPDSDCIWDGPYEIDGDNIDYYPIVPEFPSQIIIPLLIVTLLAVTVHRRKHTR